MEPLHALCVTHVQSRPVGDGAALGGQQRAFFARKGRSPLDGRTYYTLVVGSPTGKVYERTSPRLDDDGIVECIEWTADECPAPFLERCTMAMFLINGGQPTKTIKGGCLRRRSGLVRVSIGAAHVDNAAQFWRTHFPVLDSVVSKSGLSRVLTVKNIHYIFQEEMEIELSTPRTTLSSRGKHSVVDYVEYINSVRDEYAGPNQGWSAWYDRHLGLKGCPACPLDTYMRAFTSAGVAFTPTRRRPSATTSTRRASRGDGWNSRPRLLSRATSTGTRWRSATTLCSSSRRCRSRAPARRARIDFCSLLC